MNDDKDLKIAHLERIIDAYEKVNQLSQSELKDAQNVILAHEKIIELFKVELLQSKSNPEIQKSRETELKDEVMNLLKITSGNDSEFLEKLNHIHSENIKNLYSDILRILTSMSFPEDKAQEVWFDILKHSESMKKSMGREVGLRVAIVDYFQNIKNYLPNPKIIDINLFEEILKNAVIDELTQIFNRRHFNINLQREVKRSGRYKKPFCLFLFDVDNFKSYNDTYGHNEGDKALILIGKILQKSFRTEDTVARTGGEEFSVILPETKLVHAVTACERFVTSLKAASAETLKTEITISGGISCFPDDSTEIEALYIKADELAYKAKRTGKNKICIF